MHPFVILVGLRKERLKETPQTHSLTQYNLPSLINPSIFFPLVFLTEQPNTSFANCLLSSRPLSLVFFLPSQFPSYLNSFPFLVSFQISFSPLSSNLTSQLSSSLSDPLFS
ncbi:hypothetical protein Dimus_017304 [Dionaea muscipula]